MWGQATIARPVHTQTWEVGLRSFQLSALLTFVTWKRKVGEGQDTAFGPCSGRLPELLWAVASCVPWPEWDSPAIPPPSRTFPGPHPVPEQSCWPPICRTGYVTCRCQPTRKRQSFSLKKLFRILRWQQQSIKPVWGPSKWPWSKIFASGRGILGTSQKTRGSENFQALVTVLSDTLQLKSGSVATYSSSLTKGSSLSPVFPFEFSCEVGREGGGVEMCVGVRVCVSEAEEQSEEGMAA